MDEQKKDDELKDEEVKEEVKDEVKEESKEEEYVPEQLDDDDFEKEKEQAKKEKKAKKEKEPEEVQYDENGNPIQKKKKGKFKIILVILLILIIAIGGSIAYLVINPNNEQNFFSDLMIESLIKDYAIYINNEEWENVANCADIDGYIAYYVVYMESYLSEYIDAEITMSFMDFNDILADPESYYDRLIEEFPDLEESLTGYYDVLVDYAEYGERNTEEAFEAWTSDSYTISNIEIENVKSISKIEGTSLYQVEVVYSYTMPNYSSSSNTATEDLYVTRIDGDYKIVGGTNLGSVLMSAYYDGYYANVEDSDTTEE